MIGYLSSWYTDYNWLSDADKDAGFGYFCDLFCFLFLSSMWILPVMTPPLLCVQVRINSKLISSPLPSWLFVFHPERCTPEVWRHCCNYSFVTTWNGPQHGLIVSHRIKLIHSALFCLASLWLTALASEQCYTPKKHPQNQIISWNFYSFCSQNSLTDKGTPPDRGEKNHKTTSRSPHSSSEHPLSSWEWGWVECVQDKITHQNGIA